MWPLRSKYMHLKYPPKVVIWNLAAIFDAFLLWTCNISSNLHHFVFFYFDGFMPGEEACFSRTYIRYGGREKIIGLLETDVITQKHSRVIT